MNQFKKVGVMMLPTDEAHLSVNRSYRDYNIGTEVGEPYLTYSKSIMYSKSVTDSSESPQHLYIISDDKIENGDWCLNISKNIIYQKDRLPMDIMWKKIIATTDTSLMITLSVPHIGGQPNRKMLDVIKLPKPSQQFIEQYIESYNKGEVITEVLVEYEQTKLHIEPQDYQQYISQPKELQFPITTDVNEIYSLKTNKDNTINIKPIKDSRSREEVL